MVQCFTKKEDYRNAFEYGHILSSLVTDQKVNAHLIEEIIERQQKYESHIHELEIGRVRARIWLLLVAFLLLSFVIPQHFSSITMPLALTLLSRPVSNIVVNRAQR